MKSYYFTALFLFLVSIGYSHDKKKDYTDASRLIEIWLDAQRDYEQLPDISAAVIEDQEILL